MEKIYTLPNGWSIHETCAGGHIVYSLMCNGNFVHYDTTIEGVFVIFGRICDKNIET